MLVRIETLGVWRCAETEMMLPVAAGKAETKDGLEDVFLVALTPREVWEDVEVPPIYANILPDSPVGDRAQELWETEDLPVLLLNRKWIGEYDMASKQGFAHRGRIEIRPAGREWWDEIGDEPVMDIEKMMRGVEHLLERVADTILTALWPEWLEAAEDARKRQALDQMFDSDDPLDRELFGEPFPEDQKRVIRSKIVDIAELKADLLEGVALEPDPTGAAFCAVELSQALGVFDGPVGEA